MKQVNTRMNMSEVVIIYGQTETSPGVTMTTTKDPVERRVTTIGRAFPHTEFKIIDPKTGKIVPTGRSGICARGYCVMKCYYNNPSATHATLDKDHWNHTGDLATMDEKGYFKIVGRLKDMVIRGGENIYPREIEEYLHHHDKIADVHVVGVPDIKYGEELCAWVKEKRARAHSGGGKGVLQRKNRSLQDAPVRQVRKRFPHKYKREDLKSYLMREESIKKLWAGGRRKYQDGVMFWKGFSAISSFSGRSTEKDLRRSCSVF